MSDRVVIDGIEVSKATADFLAEFGMTDEEAESMWDQEDEDTCIECGQPNGDHTADCMGVN